MDNREIQELVLEEARKINKTLAAFKVRARILPGGIRVFGSAYVAYELSIDTGTSVKDVASHLLDLQAAVSQHRQRKTIVRFTPPFYIEVDHPAPMALAYNEACLKLRPNQMLVGRDYSESPSQDSVVDLEKSPHILVAGITGSGKTTLVRSMLGTLALNTSPEGLAIYLVDLKNDDDLLAFAGLPHVAVMATEASGASRAIRTVSSINDQRVAAGRVTTEARVVLVVDEFSKLDAADVKMLADVLSGGRSKRINVIAATQYPTAKVMGSLGKPNFTTRLVGKVSDSSVAYNVTGREKTGAELLPGRGSFLRIDSDVRRIQVYNFSDGATDAVAYAATQRWAGAVPPVPPVPPVPAVPGQNGAIPVYDWPQSHVSTTGTAGTGTNLPALAVTAKYTRLEPEAGPEPVRLSCVFPISNRALTEAEAFDARAMLDSGMSQNKIIDAVWGEGLRTPQRREWLRMALGIQKETR
jgi:DNA segregation ATPase FtsK/SpoIIIE-like protein